MQNLQPRQRIVQFQKLLFGESLHGDNLGQPITDREWLLAEAAKVQG